MYRKLIRHSHKFLFFRAAHHNINQNDNTILNTADHNGKHKHTLLKYFYFILLHRSLRFHLLVHDKSMKCGTCVIHAQPLIFMVNVSTGQERPDLPFGLLYSNFSQDWVLFYCNDYFTGQSAYRLKPLLSKMCVSFLLSQSDTSQQI